MLRRGLEYGPSPGAPRLHSRSLADNRIVEANDLRDSPELAVLRMCMETAELAATHIPLQRLENELSAATPALVKDMGKLSKAVDALSTNPALMNAAIVASTRSRPGELSVAYFCGYIRWRRSAGLGECLQRVNAGPEPCGFITG